MTLLTTPTTGPTHNITLPQLPPRPTCKACPLHETAKNVGVRGVWLEGSLPPGPGVPVVVMLGRNPGKNENEQGIPFVGRSGAILRNGYMGGPTPLPSLASVYLLNTVRCFTVADAEPNWSKHVKPCWHHTASDLTEIIRCHTPPVMKLSATAAGGGLTSTVSISPATPNGESTLISAKSVSTHLPKSERLVSSPPKISVVCLGGLASQAFVALGLGEPKPKSQAECFRNNAREVQLTLGSDSRPHKVFLLHTYHPAFYLRNPNAGVSIQEHLQMLIDWLQGKLVAFSKPTIVPPFAPKG